MKKRNKYMNLSNGLAFWALNNESIVFTALSIYGLMMIRDFTIKHHDSKMKSQTEALMGISALRGIITVLVLLFEVYISPFIIVLMNIVVFVLAVLILTQSLKYLTAKLQEFELVNLISKISESYYAVLIIDGILVFFSALVLFTLFVPIPILLNLISLFLNPSFNFAASLVVILAKYFASRSFSKAAIMLNNTATVENKY